MIRFNTFTLLSFLLSCWLDVSPWSYNKRKVSGYFLKFLKLFEHLKIINKKYQQQKTNNKNKPYPTFPILGLGFFWFILGCHPPPQYLF